jgi:PAS domain S-box-containing protein
VVASRWGLHRDEHGRPHSFTEINIDVTGRKRIEEQLEASEQRLRMAQAAAGIATWDWDLRTNQTVCSNGYGPLYGLPKSGMAPCSREWIEMVHPDDREKVRQELLDALAGVRQYDTEFRVVWPDGTVRWLVGKGQIYRDAAGNPVRFLGVNMDLTERKTAADQLRALSASLISVQEEERRRISRELHDDLVQRLGFISIDLARTADTVHGLPVLQDKLRALQQRAVETAELTRHIAHELHPSILDDLGIEVALRSYCEEFARREEIAVDFIGRYLPPSIKREIGSCLYAVAQESLLNVSKHARARRVEVLLEGATDRVCLTVSDDGIGFSFNRTAAQPGLGIVNMRERVRWVRGNLSIVSQPGHGTRLNVEVPL